MPLSRISKLNVFLIYGIVNIESSLIWAHFKMSIRTREKQGKEEGLCEQVVGACRKEHGIESIMNNTPFNYVLTGRFYFY